MKLKITTVKQFIDRPIYFLDQKNVCAAAKNIIIFAEWQLFNVAGYLTEERRRWPIITASPRGQCSK